MKSVYRHTPKAIRRGLPASRIFIQVDVLEGDILAWKCEERDAGIWCPWDPDNLKTLSDAVADAPLKGDNGSRPTAWFKLDSLYKRVSVS